jgi:hypothetical protein
MLRIIIALALGMHGVGHALFVGNAWGYWKTGGIGRARLFADVLGAGQPLERAAGLLMLIPLAGFLAAAGGLLSGQGWWRPLALASAVASAGLVLLFAGGLNTSSAFFAVAFDVAVIAYVLLQQRAAAGAGS